MRAVHKYNPKDPEGARRIAQSMGYKFSIWDMPEMIKLLRRADIVLDGYDYENEQKPAEQLADGDTIKI